MPGPIDLLYTTIGGVIGAGLTQYVTHLRDRRAGRAAIIEKVAAAETEYILFANQATESSFDRKSTDLSRLNAALASVEAACLIAGVPRANVMLYIVSRQFGAQIKLARSFEAWMAGEIERRQQAVEDGLLDEKMARIAEVLPVLEELQSQGSAVGDVSARLDPFAYDELRRSVWHPFIVQLRKRQLHKLQQEIKRLEVLIRSLDRKIPEARAQQSKVWSQQHM